MAQEVFYYVVMNIEGAKDGREILVPESLKGKPRRRFIQGIHKREKEENGRRLAEPFLDSRKARSAVVIIPRGNLTGEIRPYLSEHGFLKGVNVVNESGERGVPFKSIRDMRAW